MTTQSPELRVRAIYRKLARAWGPQHWWPGATSFEVIVGAILTQNTSWKNVERALANLRSAGTLSPEGIRETPISKLEELIRSSGYYRQKAKKLKAFAGFLDSKYQGSLERMFATPTERLRPELLAQHGIGRETADAILLYAGNHEIFVVDAYARRILERHGVVDSRAKYDDIRELVERALMREQFPEAVSLGSRSTYPPAFHIHPSSAMSAAKRSTRSQVFNEMHGLFVQVGKHYCRKLEPECHACPLRSLLTDRSASTI